MMACATIVMPEQQGIDKYYDCVNGNCVETTGGQYKNDPLCSGKCTAATTPPKDNTMMYIIGAAALLGAALLFGGNKK